MDFFSSSSEYTYDSSLFLGLLILTDLKASTMVPGAVEYGAVEDGVAVEDVTKS